MDYSYRKRTWWQQYKAGWMCSLLHRYINQLTLWHSMQCICKSVIWGCHRINHRLHLRSDDVMGASIGESAGCKHHGTSAISDSRTVKCYDFVMVSEGYVACRVIHHREHIWEAYSVTDAFEQVTVLIRLFMSLSYNSVSARVSIFNNDQHVLARPCPSIQVQLHKFTCNPQHKSD
jgi:hypothetical protein